MSRIGKQPIPIPASVKITLSNEAITVAGPKGELAFTFHPDIAVRLEGAQVVVTPRRAAKKSAALWGLTRALVANMVEGVTNGFQKKLDLEGVGYRVALDGTALVMQLGFSHPVRVEPPAGIAFTVEKNTITVSGISREQVGLTSATIRSLKPPEPYKGKGIRYRGEIVRRKAGKKASATAK